MVQLAQIYDQITAAGADLWAIAPQDEATNEMLRQRRAIPFPILADSDQAVIRAWGVCNELDSKHGPIPYPATYVIATDGSVQWHHLGLTTRDRPTPGAVLAALQQPADGRISGG